MFPEFQEYVNELEHEARKAIAAYKDKELPYPEIMKRVSLYNYIAHKKQTLCYQIYLQLNTEQQKLLSEAFSLRNSNTPSATPTFPSGSFGQTPEKTDIFQAFLKQACALANEEILRSAMEHTKNTPRAFDDFSVSTYPLQKRAEEWKSKAPITAKPGDQIRQDVDKAVRLVAYDPYTLEHSAYVNDLGRAFNRQRHKDMLDLVNASDDEQFKALFKVSQKSTSHYSYPWVSFGISAPTAETWQDMRQKHTFQISPELRNIYETIFQEIDAMQVVPENETFDYTTINPYINDKLLKAKTAIEAAMNSNDPLALDKLETLNAEYEAEYQKLQHLYEVGAELLKDERMGFPDNIDDQRNALFPVEFKKLYKVNACLNSIAMTHTLLRWAGVSKEEFFANPVEAMYRFEEQSLERQGFDSKIKNKSLGRILAEMSNADIDLSRDNDFANILRPIEGLNSIEPNRALAAQNGLAEIALDRYVNVVNADVRLFGAYFQEQIPHVADALFILPENEIDFRALAKTPITDPKTMTEPKPFNLAKYLATHEVDFAAMNARIKNTLGEYLQKGGNEQGYATLVKGAIKGVEAAILAKQPKMKNPDVQDLIKFCNNPVAYMTPTALSLGLNSQPPVKDQITFAMARKEFQAAQKIYAKDRKIFLKTEKAYNKQATKLQREIAKQQKISEKSLQHSKIVAAQKTLELRTQELEALKASKLESLKAAANSGLISAVYYEARRKDVIRNRQNRQPSMFVNGLCDKKSFLKEKMSNFYTKAEALKEYKALKAQEKSAQSQHEYKLFRGVSFVDEITALDSPPQKKSARQQKTERTPVTLKEALAAQKEVAKKEVLENAPLTPEVEPLRFLTDKEESNKRNRQEPDLTYDSEIV